MSEPEVFQGGAYYWKGIRKINGLILSILEINSTHSAITEHIRLINIRHGKKLTNLFFLDINTFKVNRLGFIQLDKYSHNSLFLLLFFVICGV